MRCFRGILIGFGLVFSLLAATELRAEVSVAELKKTSCGLENGIVSPGDGTLCQQDIAFGMLYEMFPSIYDEILPMWSLSSFSKIGDTPNKPVSVSNYNGDGVFFVLFDLFYELILICAAMYGVVMVVSIIIRAVKSGKFSDGGGGGGVKTWIKGAVFGGIYLIPYKHFFIGQMLVFSLGILSLSIANFAFSLILSGNQSLMLSSGNVNSYITENNSATNTNSAPATQDRHLFLADTFLRQLTRLQLCRTQSSEYILSGEGGRFSSPEMYKDAYQCSSAGKDVVSNTWNDNATSPSFAWGEASTPEDSHGGTFSFGNTSRIDFSAKPNLSSFCEFSGESVPNYDCGSISILRPNWAKNPLVRLVSDPVIILNRLASLSNSLKPTLTPLEVKSIVGAQWLGLRKDLLASLEAAWIKQRGMEKEGVGTSFKSNALREAMMDNARPHLVQASQFFHQEAMNILMFGQSTSYKGEGDIVQVHKDWTGLEYYLGVSKKAAFLISSAQCLHSGFNLEGAKFTADFLKGEVSYLTGASHARCLDVLNSKVMEYDDPVGKDFSEMRDQSIARVDSISDELVSSWNNSVNNLASQRRAIELSFSDSVNDGAELQWWVDLRQKGYLGAAEYASSINERVAGYKRAVKQIINNYSLSQSSYDDRYISQSLIGRYSTDQIFDKFSNAGNDVFSKTHLPRGMLDPLVTSGIWVSEQELLIREQPTGVDTTSIMHDLSEAWAIPTSALTRLGISLRPGDKNEKECLSNPTKCPFPLSDPFIELTMLGHDMVDVSVGFFAVAIPVKFLSGKMMNSAMLGRNAGTIKKKPSLVQAIEAGASKGALGVLVSTLSVAAIMDMLYDLLSGLMVGVLAVGLLLAYLLPLLPKLYLYMQFITWLTILVMSSFSVLLWCLFWFRYKEKHDLLKSAGYHYGVELLFKPLFSLVAVIFAWYFFTIVTFSVGIGVGWLWGLPVYTSSNYLRPFFDAFVVIALIAFVYMVGLRLAYQQMSDLSGGLLRKLGVSDVKSKDKISELIKAMMFDKVRQSMTSLNNNISRHTGRDAAKRDMMSRLGNAQNLVAEHNKSFDANTTR
jgi:hypothetical protein